MLKKKVRKSAEAIGIIGGINEETLEYLKARKIRYKVRDKNGVKILKIFRSLFKSTKLYFDSKTGQVIKNER